MREEEKGVRRVNQLWALSLIVIGCASMIHAGAGLLGLELPDWAVRVLGLADLAALPVLAYTSVRIMTDSRKKK